MNQSSWKFLNALWEQTVDFRTCLLLRYSFSRELDSEKALAVDFARLNSLRTVIEWIKYKHEFHPYSSLNINL